MKKRAATGAADFFAPKRQGEKELSSNRDFSLQRQKCPVCSEFSCYDVDMINAHITACLLRVAADKENEISPPRSEISQSSYTPVNAGISGLYLFFDFITETEEMLLLSSLDGCSNPWAHSSFNGHCDSKKYGVRTVRNAMEKSVREPGEDDYVIPKFVDFLIQRLKELPPAFAKINPRLSAELSAFQVNEFNANSYVKRLGHNLKAHVDDRQLSGPLLANLSIGAEVTMRYQHEKTREIVDVQLPRRTLQLVTQTARYDYTHSIPNCLMEDSRRVSITMRQAGGKAGVR